jgi:hypothetical protein
MEELRIAKVEVKAIRGRLSTRRDDEHKADFGRAFVREAQDRLPVSLFRELVDAANERLEARKAVARARASGSAIEPRATGIAFRRDGAL